MGNKKDAVLGKVVYKTAERNGQSWRVELPDGEKHNVPDSLVMSHTPAIKTLHVEAWFLKQEGIAFKAH